MSHARIEEVSDSDPEIEDLDKWQEDFNDADILLDRDSYTPLKLSSQTAAHAAPPPIPKFTPPSAAAQNVNHFINPNLIPSSSNSANPLGGTQFKRTEDEAKYKDFQCIYPVYFDAARSRAEGRRVGKELAVENPLARTIVDACGRLKLETLFEPAKSHPKDWGNPGRVKVKVKGGNNPGVKNKHHLYTLISLHLKNNPTTEQVAMAVQVPGAPPPDPSKEYPRPAVPRGVKMGSLLPYYSPALSGGGVSENFFKDMMAEMGGGAPGLEAPSEPAKPKKQKQKRIVVRG